VALSAAQTKRPKNTPTLASEKGSLCARIFVVSTSIILVVRSHAVVVIITPSLVKSFSNLRLFLFVCSFCHFVLQTIRLIDDVARCSRFVLLLYPPCLARFVLLRDPDTAICFMLWLVYVYMQYHIAFLSS
jgi:hypothetical protein